MVYKASCFLVCDVLRHNLLHQADTQKLTVGGRCHRCDGNDTISLLEGTPRAQTSVKAAHQSPDIFVTPETFGR